MLKKKNRADTKTVDKIFKEGTSITSPGLTLRFVKTPQTTSPRLSFIVPKSVAKSAVKRNMLRRRGYSVLTKQIHRFPANISGVFIFKNSSAGTEALESDVKIILSKL
jgi:ribonuclease P protein component